MDYTRHTLLRLYHRPGRRTAILSACAVVLCSVGVSPAQAQSKTTQVDLKLLTGGGLSGLVVDYNGEAIVVVQNTTPFVFAWNEMESGSAYAARRRIMLMERGGRDELNAADFLALGRFALAIGRRDLAASVFRKAVERDERLAETTRRMLTSAAATEQNATAAKLDVLVPPDAQHKPINDHNTFGAADDVAAKLPLLDRASPIRPLDAEAQKQVMETYRELGRRVAEAVYDELHLIETPHFMIWTDWEPRHREMLSSWCEAMYARVAELLGLPGDGNVFLAKCPVFCWRSPSRFRKFAEVVDQYDARNAAGYTRAIPANGHVHVAAVRLGHDASAMQRFAATLVHEGTHAFLHRLYSPAPIPGWVNEGVAELVTQRVLGEATRIRSKSALLAAQYARYDWPIRNVIEAPGAIGVHQYPLAYSLVSELEARGREGFAGFLKALKGGAAVGEAISLNFDGLTIGAWESQWRAAHSPSSPPKP